MPIDLLSDVLRVLRLRGVLYFHVGGTRAWAAEAPPSRAIAAAVLPGSQHVIEFHAVTAGACWAAVVGGEPVRLQAGDVVLGVNGKQIVESADLPRVIGEKRPGTRIRMEVWRDGRSRDVVATLDELTADTLASTSTPSQVESLNTSLGLSARALTEQEASQLRLRGGLVVEGVDGPAARAGIQRGDVILALNNQPVTSVGEFRNLLKSAGKRFALLIQRGEARIFVPLRLE